MDGFLVNSLDWDWIFVLGGPERPDCGPHGMRESGAPNYSNYALSWIGMANTKFLLDLYLEGINKLSCLFTGGYMAIG
jgi:hypothetical protein